MGKRLRCVVQAGAMAALGGAMLVWPAPAAGARADAIGPSAALVSLLDRAGERVRVYYERLQSMICTEEVVQHELRSDFTPHGRPRQFVYDVRLVPGDRVDAAGVAFTAERELREVDGRAPRPGHEPRCMDPLRTYSDPLAFLLPENRVHYVFGEPRRLRVDGRPADVVEFAVTESSPPSVEWEDDCVTISASGRARGRVWLDASNQDVMRLDIGLSAPVAFRMPRTLAVRLGGPARMTLERSDVSIRYQPFEFEDPHEVVRLPSSIVTLTVFDGSRVPRLRTAQTFRDYRRFEVDARVVGVRD